MTPPAPPEVVAHHRDRIRQAIHTPTTTASAKPSTPPPATPARPKEPTMSDHIPTTAEVREAYIDQTTGEHPGPDEGCRTCGRAGAAFDLWLDSRHCDCVAEMTGRWDALVGELRGVMLESFRAALRSLEDPAWRKWQAELREILDRHAPEDAAGTPQTCEGLGGPHGAEAADEDRMGTEQPTRESGTPEPFPLADFERERFTLPGRAEVYIQWKGADSCLDTVCECGAESHLDGYVFGRWTCGGCGKTFQLAWTATAYEVEPEGHEVTTGEAPDGDRMGEEGL